MAKNKRGTGEIKTFQLYAGAYKTASAMDKRVTHSCEVDSEGFPVRVICDSVPLSSIFEEPSEATTERPTCPKCAKRFDKEAQMNKHEQVSEPQAYVKDQEEDGSVNSLGTIPDGRLSKKSPAAKGAKKMSLADKVLSKVDDSQYDACIKVTDFDTNKIPEIKNAIMSKLGSKVAVQFDTEKMCFYVDGDEESVAAVKAILKEAGVQIDEEPAEEPSEPAQEEPSAEPTAEAKMPEFEFKWGPEQDPDTSWMSKEDKAKFDKDELGILVQAWVEDEDGEVWASLGNIHVMSEDDDYLQKEVRKELMDEAKAAWKAAQKKGKKDEAATEYKKYDEWKKAVSDLGATRFEEVDRAGTRAERAFKGNTLVGSWHVDRGRGLVYIDKDESEIEELLAEAEKEKYALYTDVYYYSGGTKQYGDDDMPKGKWSDGLSSKTVLFDTEDAARDMAKKLGAELAADKYAIAVIDVSNPEKPKHVGDVWEAKKDDSEEDEKTVVCNSCNAEFGVRKSRVTKVASSKCPECGSKDLEIVESEHDGEEEDDLEDGDMLDNERLNKTIERITQKIERVPAIKRASYYRILLKDIMQAVEDKPGASLAMLDSARDFLKTQF